MGEDNFLDHAELSAQLHEDRIEPQYNGDVHVYEGGKLARVIKPGGKLNAERAQAAPPKKKGAESPLAAWRAKK